MVGPPWTKVERKRKKKKPQIEEIRDAKLRRRKRVHAKREKGDALIIKTEQSKYSDILRTMRSDAKLVDLGADVRNIRRTPADEMILELKRGKEHKGAAYKSLAEEFLGEEVEVRVLTAEATQKVKNPDEVTETEELAISEELRQAGKPPGDPSAYRPICLIDTVGKVLKKIILSRMLRRHTEGVNGLWRNQFAFWKRRSIVELSYRLERPPRLRSLQGWRRGIRYCLCSIDPGCERVPQERHKAPSWVRCYGMSCTTRC